MTNAEKYKTPKERAEAFAEYTKPLAPHNEYEFGVCAFDWLNLEAEEEEPLPCPFCGCRVSLMEMQKSNICFMECENYDCGYKSAFADTEHAAIAAHNRVARAANAENTR